MMWYSGTGMHWWGWFLSFVLMIAFWGVIVWAVWYFVTSFTRRPEPPQHDVPKAILDERLARGEIDAQEYQRLLEVLQGSGARTGSDRTPAGSGGGR